MKILKLLAILLVFLISFISCKTQDQPPVPFVSTGTDLPEYRNFFGVSWNGAANLSENLAYAKTNGLWLCVLYEGHGK